MRNAFIYPQLILLLNLYHNTLLPRKDKKVIMRKFRILISLVVGLGLIVIIALSCNKGNATAVKPATQGIKATIINTDAIAADGCGYLVQTDSVTFYHADNLPNAFQKDKLDVALSYDVSTSTFQCGMNPNTHIPVIHIKEIKIR